MSEKDFALNMFGTDGAFAGNISIEGNNPETAVVQVRLTVCAMKNFDAWWHQVYSHVQSHFENHATTARENEG